MIPHLVIDGRKAFDSGIGTYVRNVVPRVCRNLRGVRTSLLVQAGSAADHQGYLADVDVELLETRAQPLKPSEQIALRRIVPADAVFWATSLSHPLFTRRPLITMLHDVAQLVLGREGGVDPLTREVARVFLHSIRQRSGLILTNSTFSQRELLRTVGAPRAGRLTVTPLGVDDAWFAASRSMSESKGTPYFVCVGNVRPHKNIPRLIDAFARVKDRLPHDLLIVGQSEGFRTADPRALQVLEALGPRARFLGHLSDAELKSVVARADAMVLPSLYEGFGLPALEAMAAGCPVLASGAGALAEVCGGAARLFDARDVGAIAEALVAHASQSEAARQACIETGRDHARSFTWQQTAALSADAIARYLATEFHTSVESYRV